MPAQRIFFWLDFAAILFFTFSRREPLSSLGLAVGGMARSLWIVGAAFILAMISVFTAVELGTMHSAFDNLPFGFRISGYVVWSFMQEFVLQVYMLTRLVRLFSKQSYAILTAALMFAVAHLPNPVLVPLTLLWGFIACFLFLRYRNLYTIGLAHAILGICVAVTVPNGMHHHMRVGLGYLRYRPQPHAAQRNNAPQTVSTQAWVIMEAWTRLSARHARP
jgi:membrane protease YdiL (CAAX protease family)